MSARGRKPSVMRRLGLSDDGALWVGPTYEGIFGAYIGIAEVRVHGPKVCAEREVPCLLHHPSEHAMRSWELRWRDDKRAFERMCPHGIGHPDPDAIAWARLRGVTGMGVHGCDGCCGVLSEARRL